jgi:acetylornithine deacetylase/succinyl-diaminopimelate desuccinylase-like protein
VRKFVIPAKLALEWIYRGAGIQLIVFLSLPAFALTPQEDLAKNIYRELVETNTVHPDGDNTAAAKAMAKRLLDAGFDPADVQVIEPAPRKGNLVARLRGTGELKPMLLLAHIDVVEARKEDWSDGLDPFRLTERDGYWYGRGVLDDKAMAAAFVANLIAYRKEGFRPKRDIIVALTADEEGGTHNGVAWLLKNHRSLVDAEFALNEGGGGQYRGGKPFIHGVQVGEKMYLSFDFEATNPGGHSSVPERDNAIYELAAAMDRLAGLELPPRIGYVTRAYLAKLANIEEGQLALDIAALAAGRGDAAALKRVSAVARYNAQIRTTCVATRIEGGHADNALPQRAKATVNCRLLPGEDPAFVLAELQKAAGSKVKVTARGNPNPSEATDAQSPVMKAIGKVSDAMWPGTPVVPVMSTGATDGSRLRNADIPTYGVSGIFVEYGELRIHGRDERIATKAFFEANRFLYLLVRDLSSGP